jgi:hypothetical protein
MDYTLDFPCEPKRRFGASGLMRRLHALEAARSAPLSEPEGVAARQAVEFELRPVAFFCSRCPANHAGGAFGCFGSVGWPLAPEAEEWLFELLPQSLKVRKGSSPEGRRQIEYLEKLLDLVRAAGVDGQVVDQERQAPEQLPRPVARRYGPLLRRVRVTSSQLLQVMFGGEKVEPGEGELLCRALGVWTDGAPSEDGLAEAVFTEPVEEGDHPAIAEVKQFLLALVVACSLNVSVRLQARAGAESPPP